MKKTLIILSVIFLAACGSVKLLTPTQADADRAAQKFPGMTLADLNQGKAAFEKNCTMCHSMKNPASKTEDKWRKTVPIMVGRANKKTERIDSATQESILRYLITMSKPSK